MKRAKKSAHSSESFCQPYGDLRGREKVVTKHDLGSTPSGLDPEQAIDDWIKFAKEAGYLRVSGNRTFSSDLERIDTMSEEGQSLFEFAKSIGLGFPEKTLKIAQNSPRKKGGAEHQVFFDIGSQAGRVIKVTFPDKFGRWEHTPFLYLERCQLLNEMIPAVDIRLEDCICTSERQISIVTSMQYFSGGHPTSSEADGFIKSLGFEPLKDRSDTLDYINYQSKLIIRDCHPLNWIKAKQGLVPIDIIPERYLG